MKKFRVIVAALVATLMISGTSVMTVSAASCGTAKNCVEQGLSATGADTGNSDLASVLSTITNVLMFLVGAVSVIMLIIGGFRYVVSQGDQSQVTSAKNTILYAVIGLVVAIMGYTVISFVISTFVK